MKIMIVGHNGMLGKAVHDAVYRMGHTWTVEESLDITDEILVADCCPDVVINCAGLVPQRDPPPTAAQMMRVNGYGPWNLADWCDQIEARLIQVSTDCVFDGVDYNPDGSPHFESSPPQPITPYGYSKLAGEIYREPHLTIRTSFVGFGERGLIAELEQCAEKDELYRASCNLYWTGHIVRFVAEALVILAERDIKGLLHIPGEEMTRLDLVRSLSETLDIQAPRGGGSWSQAYGPKIDRRLGSERWEKEGLPALPSFEWQLEWLRRSR